MQVGEFKVKATRLPVLTQDLLEPHEVFGRDFPVETGVDERFEIHAKPSAFSCCETQS